MTTDNIMDEERLMNTKLRNTVYYTQNVHYKEIINLKKATWCESSRLFWDKISWNSSC